MKIDAEAPRFEPRWPVAVAILVVIFLLAVLPGRIRLLPLWVSYAFGAAMLIPIAAVQLTAAKAWSVRLERAVTFCFFIAAVTGTLANLGNLIEAIIDRATEISGLQLLASTIALWATNVLMFSLLYWQIDRGGPEPRLTGTSARPDWLFPQEGAPADEVLRGWQPRFIDYLYLGYSTATAFSTTDAMPLTSRAKLLMMLESMISLMIIVVVASRAINILGN
jgi:hypothetical protein